MGMLLRRYYEAESKKVAASEIPTEKVEDTAEQKQYSKTEVNRIPLAELKQLAPTLGISVTDESTGSELKKKIIAKLGL